MQVLRDKIQGFAGEGDAARRLRNLWSMAWNRTTFQVMVISDDDGDDADVLRVHGGDAESMVVMRMRMYISTQECSTLLSVTNGIQFETYICSHLTSSQNTLGCSGSRTKDGRFAIHTYPHDVWKAVVVVVCLRMNPVYKSCVQQVQYGFRVAMMPGRSKSGQAHMQPFGSRSARVPSLSTNKRTGMYCTSCYVFAVGSCGLCLARLTLTGASAHGERRAAGVQGVRVGRPGGPRAPMG